MPRGIVGMRLVLVVKGLRKAGLGGIHPLTQRYA